MPAVRRFLPITAVAFIAACVPYNGPMVEDSRSTTIVSGSFPLLDPGAAQVDSLHFRTRAYGNDNAQQVSDVCEKAYNRIMVDTNLFSFRPNGLYQIVIYGSPDEYHKKTSQPEWSAGVTVGNSIYTYLSNPRLNATLAHEMSHLVFFEYMGKVTLGHRWVNEGLAVYEEAQALGVPAESLFGQVRATMRQLPIPMDQMIHLTPATEKEYMVSLWYAQAVDMVRFMIDRGGSLGFSQFLKALSQDRAFDDAIAAGFPGHWQTLAGLERDWQRSLQ